MGLKYKFKNALRKLLTRNTGHVDGENTTTLDPDRSATIVRMWAMEMRKAGESTRDPRNGWL